MQWSSKSAQQWSTDSVARRASAEQSPKVFDEVSMEDYCLAPSGHSVTGEVGRDATK